jgi:hypothetical protein
VPYPTPVRTSSGSRVGFQHFATEAEAREAADYWKRPEVAGQVADANIGITQVGYQGQAADGTYVVVVP